MAGTIDDRYTTLGAIRTAMAELPDDTVVMVNQIGNLSLYTMEHLDEDDIADWQRRHPEKPNAYKLGQAVPGEMVGWYDVRGDEYTPVDRD